MTVIDSAIAIGRGTGSQRRTRIAVGMDALASAGVGVLLVAGAGVLDSRFGMRTGALVAAGAAMLAWAAELGLVLRRPHLSATALKVIIALNVAWIIGSVAVLVTGWPDRTALGNAFIIAQALAVAGLSELQVMALRAGGRAAGTSGA